MKMNLKVILLAAILTNGIESTHSLTCRHCYYAEDVTKCGATTNCPGDDHCGIHTFTSSTGITRYHAGCISTEVCEGKQEAPINIFGRRRRRQTKTVLIQCCDTDLCNVDPNSVPTDSPMSSNTTLNKSSSEKTQGTTTPLITSGPQLLTTTINNPMCVDHPDCSYLLQKFTICNDSNTATTICPNACGMCTTATVNPCVDTSEDCQILIAHFHVCKDIEFSMAKCRKSCNLCVQTTGTISNRETPKP